MENVRIYSHDQNDHLMIERFLSHAKVLEPTKEIFFLFPRFRYEGYADVIEFALSILPKGNKVIICNSYEFSYQMDCMVKYPGLQNYKNLIFLQIPFSIKEFNEAYKRVV